MKLVIWIGCMAVTGLIMALLIGNGLLKAIPMFILLGAMVAAADKLCKAWDNSSFAKTVPDDITRDTEGAAGCAKTGGIKMKRYYRKEETPLKFHKFFWFMIPIGILASIVKVASELNDVSNFHWFLTVNLACYIIDLALLAVGFTGFFRWRAYAWYAVMSYLYFGVVYNVFLVVIYAVYIPEQMAAAAGQLLGISLYSVLIGIYYLKRRPLFFEGSAQSGGADTSGAGDFGGNQQRGIGNPPRAGYCPHCGRELPSGSAFCPYCGEKLKLDQHGTRLD
ncbi:MAG: zinc ribbon domain-containing protein [Oscillospiraceae bacterium]